MQLRASELISFASLLSVIVNFCSCITLLSRSSSYAVFPPWTPDVVGRLEFRFKTFYSTSLLLYIEEKSTKSKNKRSFLELSLQKGSIKLVVQMGGEDFWSKKQRRFGDKLNDLEWHSVEITRDSRKTKVKIDTWSFELVNTGETSSLPVNSDLYVGGLPKELRSKVVNGRVAYTPRFVGCIADLAYTSSDKPVRPVYATKAEQVAQNCVDACDTHKDRICGNGGKCINRFSTVVCNCLGTGFEGRNCTIPSLSVYFRGLEYLVWAPARSQSTPSHHIIIRFKTYLENGILFSTGSTKDFLIIEIFNGRLRMAIDLGGGLLEMIVGRSKLNDHLWHRLEITRSRSYLIINLDDSSIKNGTTPGRNSNFDIPYYENIYFGGHKDPRQLERSKSKQNFAGCMQHIFYNDVNILFRKFNTLSTQISSSGYVQKGCPVTTPTVPVATTNYSSSTTSQVLNHSSTNSTKNITMPVTTKGKTVTVNNNVYGSQNSIAYRKASLSKSQIAWITSGIIVGALFLVFTTACLVHRCKKRYDGFLLSSALKNKDNQLRPNQRYKGERVVFLENGTKEKLDKVTSF